MCTCDWCSDKLPEDVELEHPESREARPTYKGRVFCSTECRDAFIRCQCHHCGGDMADQGPDASICIDCGRSN